MIKLLHLPINAPRGVLRVTKTTSLSQPSFVVSVLFVFRPWRVLSGRVGCVPFALVVGWDEDEGRAGRGGASFLIVLRWVEVDAWGRFGFFVMLPTWTDVEVSMTCLSCC